MVDPSKLIKAKRPLGKAPSRLNPFSRLNVPPDEMINDDIIGTLGRPWFVGSDANVTAWYDSLSATNRQRADKLIESRRQKELAQDQAFRDRANMPIDKEKRGGRLDKTSRKTVNRQSGGKIKR